MDFRCDVAFPITLICRLSRCTFSDIHDLKAIQSKRHGGKLAWHCACGFPKLPSEDGGMEGSSCCQYFLSSLSFRPTSPVPPPATAEKKLPWVHQRSKLVGATTSVCDPSVDGSLMFDAASHVDLSPKTTWAGRIGFARRRNRRRQSRLEPAPASLMRRRRRAALAAVKHAVDLVALAEPETTLLLIPEGVGRSMSIAAGSRVDCEVDLRDKSDRGQVSCKVEGHIAHRIHVFQITLSGKEVEKATQSRSRSE